jgi:Type I restriction enzyme R protein N terminus (HSDR_N)
MPQTSKAREVDLDQLQEDFGLVYLRDRKLFAEGSIDLPSLTVAEMELLDEVNDEFSYLSTKDALEPIVKMVVLSPLLRIAGFFRPPFKITAEKKVELVTEDEGLIVRGLIDLLVFYNQIWIVTIEAKRAEYSLKVAFPQVLTYMLASPTPQPIVSGLVTNGSEFRFIQLHKGEKPGEKPTYVMSDLLSIDRGDDLYRVARILKYLGQQII